MERLHDDENGYGPKGKDFIPHIDISEEVWSSYTRIKESIKRIFLVLDHFSKRILLSK